MTPLPPSAMVAHLWQSTLFAGVIWLIALALRSNHARVRCWLWVAASVKFLVPFSALIALGAQFEWRTAIPVAQPAASFVMHEVLAPPTFAAPPSASIAEPSSVVPAMLAAAWLVGTLVVLFWWWRQWQPVRLASRRAVSLTLGPAYDARDMVVMSSASALEPGIVGIWRPVLLLPDGLAERLTTAQLRALIAHERCHIRCHDNLAAAIHMLVEAVFWFHPLVWWIERRMIEERERACDEAVLRSGSEPQDYAEGILEVCRSSMESPLACVAGVSGANLRRRIDSIMGDQTGRPMTMARRLALALAGVSLFGIPVLAGLGHTAIPLVTVGQEPDTPVVFEVAAVRTNTSGESSYSFRVPPGGGFIATNVTLRELITYGYQIRDNQLVNAPDWIRTARYDINARLEGEPPAVPQGQPDARRLALRSLLADRFKLVMHRETREVPVYALTMARPGGKPGPKLTPSLVDCSPEMMKARRAAVDAGKPLPGSCGSIFNTGRIRFGGFPMSEFAKAISPRDGRTVVDRTGLTGNWELDVIYTPDRVMPPGQDAPVIDPNAPPSFVTALQEQLGLKLEPTRGPVEVLVVDRIERLTEDQAGAAPQPASSRLTFEVASIKRTPEGAAGASFAAMPGGRLHASNNPAANFIGNAYGFPRHRVLNLPDWVNSERYEVHARAGGEASHGEVMLMLQRLLEDRFKLTVHRERREDAIYVLTVARGGPGPKLRESKDGGCVDRSPGRVLPPEEKRPNCGNNLQFTKGPYTEWTAVRIDMRGIASALANFTRRTVVDKTGLKGFYDIQLLLPPLEPAPGIEPGESPFTVLREELGLVLEPARGPVEYLVIDSISRPTEN